MDIKFASFNDMNGLFSKNKKKKEPTKAKEDFELFAKDKGVDTSPKPFSEFLDKTVPPPKLSEEETNLNKIRADGLNGAIDLPSDLIFNEDKAREMGFDDSQITNFKFGKFNPSALDHLTSIGLYSRAEPPAPQVEEEPYYEPTYSPPSRQHSGYAPVTQQPYVPPVTEPSYDSGWADYKRNDYSTPVLDIPVQAQNSFADEPDKDNITSGRSFFSLLGKYFANEFGANSRYSRGGS